jgi:cysteine desulfurase
VIYLDYNASTPVAAEVVEAMRPFLLGHYGNPSGSHAVSQSASRAIDDARAQVAELLAVTPAEVVFTSGGSESNNTAIKGVVLDALAEGKSSPKMIVSAVEHPSVMEPCRFLERFGARTEVIGVDAHGLLRLEQLERALDDDTVLVSVMHANNEVGTLQPIAEVASLAHARGAMVHCDAAQSLGKLNVSLPELGADMLTIAGHKMYAPKGVGALVVRSTLSISPLIHGGAQQGGRRAGTENALGAVALGAACKLARDAPCGEHLLAMRERLHRGLLAHFEDAVVLHGHRSERLPNTLNVGFVGRRSGDILAKLQGVAVSAGSACHSGSTELSGVLAAMGVTEREGLGAIRFSVGRQTTVDEIDTAIERVIAAMR